MSKLQKIILALGTLILVPVLLYGGRVFMPTNPTPISPKMAIVEQAETPKEVEEKRAEPVTIEDEELAVVLTPLSGDALRILSGANVLLGSNLQIQWSVKDVSAAKGMVLNLVRDVPVEEIYNYRGATGPLTLEPIEIEASNGLIKWDTDKVGCAPTDYPTWCDTQPGNYYLQALVYDRADFSILGWPDRSLPAPKQLQSFRSESFEITGTPDLEPLQRELQGKALELFVLEFGVDLGGGIFVAQDFAKTDKKWTEVSGTHCLTYWLMVPFSGAIKACGNPGKRDEGFAEILKPLAFKNTGTKPYPEAKAWAKQLATEQYLDRVAFPTQPTPEAAGYPGYEVIDFYEWSRQNPEATTYLSSTLRDWNYRDDQWVFVYEVNKAGGSDNGPDRFNDRVLVVVPNKGSACVVETTSTRSFKSDYKTDELICS